MGPPKSLRECQFLLPESQSVTAVRNLEPLPQLPDCSLRPARAVARPLPTVEQLVHAPGRLRPGAGPLEGLGSLPSPAPQGLPVRATLAAMSEEPGRTHGAGEEAPSGQACGHCGRGLPMALRACLSSRAKAVRGTSSDTGMMATVERLLAGIPESHLPPAECSPNW